MSHYAKVVDYPDRSWLEPTEINWENFFQPLTPFEVYLFQTSLPKPDVTAHRNVVAVSYYHRRNQNNAPNQ
jgi:hypothetical protein